MKVKVEFEPFNCVTKLTFCDKDTTFSTKMHKKEMLQMVDDMIAQVAKEQERDFQKAA